MDSVTPAARLLLALAALTLTPLGLGLLRAARTEPSPHLMVMLVFSGSLALLVGLVGAFGLVVSRRRPDSTAQTQSGPESRSK